jgi:hypothetical protein
MYLGVSMFHISICAHLANAAKAGGNTGPYLYIQVRNRFGPSGGKKYGKIF